MCIEMQGNFEEQIRHKLSIIKFAIKLLLLRQGRISTRREKQVNNT